MLFYVPSNKFLISRGKTQGIQIWSTSMVKQRSSFQKLHAVVPCSSTLPLPNLLQPKDAKLYHLWYAAQSPMLYSLGIASSNKVETLSPSLINIKFIHSYWILIDSQAYFDLSSLLWLSPRSDLDALWPIYGPMAPLLPLTWCRSVVVRVTIFGRAYYLAGMATHGNPWQPRTSTWLKTWLVKGWRSSKRWPAPNVLEEGGPWRTMEDQSCDLQRPCHDSTSGARPINVSPSCRPNKHNTTRPRYKWGWSERHTLVVMDPWWTVLHSLRDIGQIWEVVFPCNIPYLDLNSHNITSQRLYS